MTSRTYNGRHGGLIVVGIDGSAATFRAVRWAATEAARRNLTLRLVHAHVPPMFGDPPVIVTTAIRNAHMAQAHGWLRAAAAQATAVASTIDVQTAVRVAEPVPALKAESRWAKLVVVGSRGSGGFPGLALGSTAEALAGRAHCPVAVIPASPHLPADTPVVVGVDGSPVSEAAIAVAFDEASARNVPLIAVHSWHELPMGGPFATMLTDDQLAQVEATESRLLAEQLAGWQNKYPDVQVQRVLTRNRPVSSLLARAATAQLLVVGSHGRGGFTRMLLGSTSRAVLHRSSCPVIVVRPERTAR